MISPFIHRALDCRYPRLSSHSFFQPVLRLLLVIALGVSAATAEATTVRMETNLGTIDIELFDDEAPKTVANFLRYAGLGYYNGVMIHRSEPGFVIQGGGYKCCNSFNQFYSIPTGAPVPNEFDPSRSNVRGTIAMAKTSNPDSATSQWFFNLADNSATLDDTSNSGGFTVFGRVRDPGMNVVDAIATLNVLNFPAPYNQLPVLSSYDQANGIQAADLVIVNRIPNVKAAALLAPTVATFAIDVDLTFNTVGAVNSSTALAWLESFKSPPGASVYFNNGMLALTVSGVTGTAGRAVILHDGATTRPNRYYGYGPTPDDPSPHWYEFMYDGETGAEIRGNRIILHFVDGKRGDGDRSVNGSIAHTGAQAVVTATDNGSAGSGGCSIAKVPPDATRGGDWVMVALFLTTLAFVRKRMRR